MPPPKKVDLLPQEQKDWLKEALKDSGFSGYEQIADDLNARLEEAGITMRIGKSALHNFGQEYAEFVKYQEQASEWAAEWMSDNGLEEEAKRHNVLFQMITTLAFKVMQSKMTQKGEEIDPQDLHFIGRLMKDVMSSSGIREKVLADERVRIQKAATEKAAEKGAKAAREAGLSAEASELIKAEILGVEA